MAALSALQCFGFLWTTAAKATHLQELAGHFRPRLSLDAKDRAFVKNGSCIQISNGKPLHKIFNKNYVIS